MVHRTLMGCVLLAMSPAVFAEDIMEATVGQATPDFTATGIDGKKFTLSDKLKAGERNIVLLFSRASW
ncbi:MAG: hypothetical protein ABGZ35_23080 [Planctomycetaceae bacterium]